MKILGISAFTYDAAACLIEDGEIVAAAQEERFTRKKHDGGFPVNAIKYCLGEARLGLADVDGVAVSGNFLDKEGEKNGMPAFAGMTPSIYSKNDLIPSFDQIDHVKNLSERFLFLDSSVCSVASAFYPSPYDEAAILVLGWDKTVLAVGKGSSVEILEEFNFPDTLGFLYSAFTEYLGFKIHSGEYKVMGLAPYGKPVYAEVIKEKFSFLSEDPPPNLPPRGEGLQRIPNFREFFSKLEMAAILGFGPRESESEIRQEHMDMAASVQVVTEEVVIKFARYIREKTGLANLCMAGDVALNCAANGKLLKQGIFERIWVQPASGPAGDAVGAALAAFRDSLSGAYPPPCLPPRGEGLRRLTDGMCGALLGPEYGQEEIDHSLNKFGAVFDVLPEDEVIRLAAQALADGKIIGWFQGRMEFGPRALGNRSILADPRLPDLQKRLNRDVKRRELFRPYAPSVLRERVADWFDFTMDSPYMLFVTDVREGKDIPAVTHVDRSARVQTVHKDLHPKFHKLISQFDAITGCPVVVNTSFNVRGEPIVCTPDDAFRCFMGTAIDLLVIGDCVLWKREQLVKISEENKFDLD